MTSVCYQADLCSSVVIKYEYFKTPRAAEAALKCYGCHGSQITEDIRPLDDSFRNPSSGGFQGNHRTHLGMAAVQSSCAKCHPGSNSWLVWR